MKITKKEYEERLEIIKMAVEEGANSKKEICEKTGYSLFVLNNTLDKFPSQAREIQNKMKKATKKKSCKTKGKKASQTRKVETIKETAKNEKGEKGEKGEKSKTSKEQIAVLDISMLNVENVIEILQDYMDKGIKIAVSNTTLYQINSNRERRNENGEKSIRAKRAADLLDFLQKRKEELKPILITGEQSMESLLLKCKELNNESDVAILTGSQIMDLTAWTFGISSKYFPKEVITPGNGKRKLEEKITIQMSIPTKDMQQDDINTDFNEKIATSTEIPAYVMQREDIESDFGEKLTLPTATSLFDIKKDIIKTLPETSFDENGDLYMENEFDLLQVKTYRGEEKDVSSKVKLEKGDLVFIAIRDDERLILEYYKIIETSIRNHAKRLYKKTIFSFEPAIYNINNSEFKKFAEKAAKKVFEK